MPARPHRPRRRAAAPYHHGDLRAALLRAAEEELAERGTEDFSLRGVARRVGVSHAAPAHHFADAGALLTALAAEGFRRFLATQRARQASAPPDPRAQLLAAGQGYVAFAAAHPALFRLMFASRRADYADAGLADAAGAAYDHLVAGVAAAHGGGVAPPVDVLAAWAMAHGIADLANSGRLSVVAPGAAGEAMVAAALERALGPPTTGDGNNRGRSPD
ncbi:MAG: TetR/AcrR family transcriptional regulator [Alphaproteobacteria bacterium]|nr:TetR/AcrR family transcriptional regulator [Alphaproteobacteria bacterium]